MKATRPLPYVIAEVKDLQIAVSTTYVQEIIRRPRWHEIPNAPRHLRGVINLRGKVLALMDLRLRLGLPSALADIEQMVAMLVTREQDHINWLKELLGAVTERRPFTLARDPSECAFGKWYYSYKPADIGFASVMYRLELPHRRIHAIADVVLKHAEHGEHDKAREIIQRTEQGDLRSVISLFAEARTAFQESHKEVAIILNDGRKHLSFTVDSVVAVEPLAEGTIEDVTPAMGGIKSDLLSKVVQRADGKGIAWILDTQALLADHRATP